MLQSVSTAISYRRLDFIKFLFFDFGVDLTKSTYPARSPFGDAATGGRMEIVKFFVENIPYDLNEKEDTTGFSLIQSCVSINFDGNQNMIEYLISLGAKYDIPAKNGTTAFYECATCVNLNLAKFFFKLGCNIKQQDRFGDSMMFAVIFNRVKAPIEKQMEMLRWLSENGCDINKPNKTGKSVLSTTIEWNLPELTTFLLSLGANPNFLHPPNKIPLIMQASSRGNFEIVKILHKSGADLKFANSAGIDIVADVVTRGYIEILEYFINVGGCQINTQQSLVAIPCQTGDLKMLKFLVENGASLTAVDLDLIALAKSCEHPHIVKYLQVGMPRFVERERERKIKERVLYFCFLFSFSFFC